MKKIIIIIVFFTAFNLHSQWKPVGDNIKTKWADNIDPENVLKEYPRPLLVRKDWKKFKWALGLFNNWKRDAQT